MASLQSDTISNSRCATSATSVPGILEAANASGKIIEGHARELTGPGLMAYLSAGISADHEIGSGADALEKLRAGFTVEIRGSHAALTAATGWEPRIPLDATLSETVAWWRQELRAGRAGATAHE